MRRALYPNRIVAVFLTVIVLATGFVVAPVGHTVAGAELTATQMEAEFLQRLNRLRVDRRLPPLQLDRFMSDKSRGWSRSMALRNELEHEIPSNGYSPGYSVTTCAAADPAWRGCAENVGTSSASSVKRMHDAFVGSPHHLANMVGNYNRVGIGVYVRYGRLWVTVRFLRGTPISTTTGLEPPPPPRCMPGMSDVSIEHPFCDEIRWLVESGVANGYADGRFGAGDPVKRQAMAAFLGRLADGTVTACSRAPFPDVLPSNPFCEEIRWLVTTGVATGYTDGHFGPGDVVKRQAMAAFLARLLDVDPPACTRAPFADVPVHHPFCAEIAWLARAGIASGYADGRFGPGDVVKRQAMAAFLSRVEMD